MDGGTFHDHVHGGGMPCIETHYLLTQQIFREHTDRLSRPVCS